MDTLITQLDQKYEQYKDRLYGAQFVDSDTLVFDSVYEYFCITETQPKIREIIEKDKVDFEKRKQDIITYNTSADTQKEFIENAEFNSLSFCYSEILKAVYTPINKHRHALNPLSATDIIGDTPLFREKFVNVMNFLVVGFVKLCKIPIKKDVEARTALYKMTYNFKRKKYPLYMEKVHTLLVQQLLTAHTHKQELSAIESTKIHIIFEDKKGVYRADNMALAYPVRKGKKRYRLIRYVMAKDNISIGELADKLNQSKELTMKEIGNINQLVRKNLEVVEDLIIHINTGGYSLNKEHFHPEILQ